MNERDGSRVRALLRRLGGAHSSSLCIAELAATLVRHVREGALEPKQSAKLQSDFLADVEASVWTMIAVSDALMRRVAARLASVPPSTYVRAGDAIHLCSAAEAGFSEVWTNDRYMLGAAAVFGLRGRSV